MARNSRRVQKKKKTNSPGSFVTQTIDEIIKAYNVFQAKYNRLPGVLLLTPSAADRLYAWGMCLITGTMWCAKLGDIAARKKMAKFMGMDVVVCLDEESCGKWFRVVLE